MPTSYLEGLKEENDVQVVPMDGVAINFFNFKRAIGTEGLSACSVVVIASSNCAILAHIQPMPWPTPPDPSDFGDAYVHQMMDQVRNIYNSYRAWFSSPTTRLICVQNEYGAVAMPEHQGIMINALQEMGLVPILKYYRLPVGPRIPGQGTVVVEGGSHGPVIRHDDFII